MQPMADGELWDDGRALVLHLGLVQPLQMQTMEKLTEQRLAVLGQNGDLGQKRLPVRERLRH